MNMHDVIFRVRGDTAADQTTSYGRRRTMQNVTGAIQEKKRTTLWIVRGSVECSISAWNLMCAAFGHGFVQELTQGMHHRQTNIYNRWAEGDLSCFSTNRQVVPPHKPCFMFKNMMWSAIWVASSVPSYLTWWNNKIYRCWWNITK